MLRTVAVSTALRISPMRLRSITRAAVLPVRAGFCILQSCLCLLLLHPLLRFCKLLLFPNVVDILCLSVKAHKKTIEATASDVNGLPCHHAT